MVPFLKKYGFGPFAVLMMILGLNDYQLKGKAEVAYWLPIMEHLNRSSTPTTPEDLISILAPFYKTERIGDSKIVRLEKFLQSELARRLWNQNSQTMANEFINIWRELTRTMGQRPEDKTIVFSMKCLGIALMQNGEYGFNFNPIPIPVDSRVIRFTKQMGFGSDNPNHVRNYWNEILRELQATHPKLNMIHLDSLVWQIASYEQEQLMECFEQWHIPSIGKKLDNLRFNKINNKDQTSKENIQIGKILVIIPCGKGKIWKKNPNQGSTHARDAYIGSPFKVNKEYAEHFADYWVILSAEYGFIPPDFIIPESYDTTFKDMSTNPVSVLVLQQQIQEQYLDRFDTIIGLGGIEYRKMIELAFTQFSKKVHFPFAGLPVGVGMKAIKNSISNNNLMQ